MTYQDRERAHMAKLYQALENPQLFNLQYDTPDLFYLFTLVQFAARGLDNHASLQVQAQRLGRALQKQLSKAHPDLAPLLEYGWNPIYDIDQATGDYVDAVPFTDAAEEIANAGAFTEIELIAFFDMDGLGINRFSDYPPEDQANLKENVAELFIPYLDPDGNAFGYTFYLPHLPQNTPAIQEMAALQTVMDDIHKKFWSTI